MTLCKRIIPTLLVRGRTLVKGKQFSGDRSIGHVLQAAKVHAMRGVDELCIMDIGATAEGRGPDLGMVRELTEGCFIPCTIGGGVKTLDDIDALLRAGADKVLVGTWATKGKLLSKAAARFGSQAIVASLDIRDGKLWARSGEFGPIKLISMDGSKEDRYETPTEIAQWQAAQGAGEILLQSIDRDGMMTGFDLELIREVASAVSIPVIASGGCSGYPDMLDAIKAGADAVAAGALFAFTDAVPRGAAKFLKANGVEVRL